MVTEISGAGLGYSVAIQAGAAGMQRAGSMLGGPDSTAPPQSTDVAGTKASRASSSTRVAGVFAQLVDRQSVLNETAATVREVGTTAAQVGQLLDKAASKLDQIVKMFPPYPVDNPARIKLLDKVDGLRQQIEKLTYPLPQVVATVGKTIAANAASAGTGSDASGAAVNDKKLDWKLLPLDPKTASDAQVSQALDQIKAVKSSLQEMQAGMWRNVVGYIQPTGSPEGQASSVRSQLADLGGQSIGSNASQLVQAAEAK